MSMVRYECDLQTHSVTSDEDDANEEIRLSNQLRTNRERPSVISVGSDYHVGGNKSETTPSELGKDGIIFDYFRAMPLLVALTLKNPEE